MSKEDDDDALVVLHVGDGFCDEQMGPQKRETTAETSKSNKLELKLRIYRNWIETKPWQADKTKGQVPSRTRMANENVDYAKILNGADGGILGKSKQTDARIAF